PYDEDTPFYFDGTLYFSTNGRPTLGGLDVYHSDWNGSNWSKPENMGKAYNSSVDDLSFRVFDEGYAGFMTSNREGGRSVKSKTCCDDMYGFTVDRLFADLVVGVFTAETSTQKPQPLLGSTVKLTATENGLTGSPESQTKADGNQFNYGLNLENAYQVIASAEGYYPDTFMFNTLGLEESKTTVHRFFLEAISVVYELDTIDSTQPIVLENILYDFDDDKILPSAEPDLEYIKVLLDKYPDMKIEMSSHTDFRGDNAYNLRLSQKRADSARRWLIRNGVDGGRIRAKGYGETVPQVVNAKNASRYDFLNEGDALTESFITQLATEEQQEAANQLNRRTEFKNIAGPTSIIIDRKIIERRVDGSDRKAAPIPQPAPKVAPAPAPKQQPAPKKEQPAPEKARQTSLSPKSLPYQSSLSREESLAGLPVLVFGQRELQLGRVNHGEKRSFSYIFTNKGDSPAQISLITACECTTTTHDNSKVYQPGQSGVIQVSFDSTEKDESETIDIDILLKQRTKSGEPIMETVQYSYELVK
ncbi:MAG: OmpA family protein, partial [Saprospiraceae bacterium]